MSNDDYSRMGEFHDLFMDRPWERLRPVLDSAFGRLASDAVLLDLGAGSGVGTRHLARATPAQIVAVEPSLTMRAVLTARVVDDPDLVTRVSILAEPAPGVLATIDGALDGFVCARMLGHVSPGERADTFAGLAARLAPAATGVVVVNPDGPPGEPDHAVDEERQIGAHRYVSRQIAADSGAGYISEYEVADGDRILRRERFAGSWSTITLATLGDELAPHGLLVEPVLAGVGLVRQASSR